MRSRPRLIGSALVCVLFLASTLAVAEPLTDSEKIERLERQTDLLQKELKALKAEIAKTKAKQKTAKVEAPPPTYVVAATPTSVAATPSGNPADLPILKSLPQFAGVNFTLWGWLEAATVFRQHNTVNDMLTVFNAIPYPYSPLYNEHELHGTARQSQISLLADSNIDAAQKLTAYLELDFLGVGTSSNYLDTNDWPPRIRHAYLTYDNDIWGFHLLAGQDWSMVMPDKDGITPRGENIPLTINANYLPGYDFTRNWQIRFVKDFNKTLWLGLSLENPATLLAPGIPATVNGLAVNTVNTGTGGFLNDVPVTPNMVPDIVEKIAWDPGWGHYELLALQRFFTNNTLCVTAAPTGCVPGVANSKTAFGAGVGGSFLLPVIPRYLFLMGGGMYGRGIGRYGAGNLPDVTIAADGSPAPITALQAWGGIEADPWAGLQLYAYGGIEQAQANYFGAFGYGNPAYDNSGCMIPTAATFATGISTTCVANNRRLEDAKIGFWQDLYKGPFGHFVVGAELEYIKRTSFSGIGGAPSTDDIVGFTSLRFYY